MESVCEDCGSKVCVCKDCDYYTRPKCNKTGKFVARKLPSCENFKPKKKEV